MTSLDEKNAGSAVLLGRVTFKRCIKQKLIYRYAAGSPRANGTRPSFSLLVVATYSLQLPCREKDASTPIAIWETAIGSSCISYSLKLDDMISMTSSLDDWLQQKCSVASLAGSTTLVRQTCTNDASTPFGEAGCH